MAYFVSKMVVIAGVVQQQGSAGLRTTLPFAEVMGDGVFW
jgi:hypothetical protein